MTAASNPIADLTAFAHRSQNAASDALETWIGVVHAVGEATESQAKNLRQILHGMFDLMDQAFTVEREVATYLTIASRVSASAADSCRELTDIALGTIEAAAQVAGRSR
jgi:regulator of sirC expression with transglutaminase-like and TPR domain